MYLARNDPSLPVGKLDSSCGFINNLNNFYPRYLGNIFFAALVGVFANILDSIDRGDAPRPPSHPHPTCPHPPILSLWLGSAGKLYKQKVEHVNEYMRLKHIPSEVRPSMQCAFPEEKSRCAISFATTIFQSSKTVRRCPQPSLCQNFRFVEDFAGAFTCFQAGCADRSF